jgi:hypothetical protein
MAVDDDAQRAAPDERIAAELRVMVGTGKRGDANSRALEGPMAVPTADASRAAAWRLQ